MANVRIDSEAFKEFLNENNLTMQQLSRELGRTGSFVSSCVKRGAMTNSSYDFLCRRFNLPNGALLWKEKPQQKATASGAAPFSIVLEVNPKTVRMDLLCNGEEMYHAYAGVKGDTEKDLVQAISYAAHMIYKMSEQAHFARKGERK